MIYFGCFIINCLLTQVETESVPLAVENLEEQVASSSADTSAADSAIASSPLSEDKQQSQSDDSKVED